MKKANANEPSFYVNLFTIFVMLLSTTAVLPLLRQGSEFKTVEGDSLMQVLWFISYIITIVLLFKRFKESKKIFSKDIMLWLIILLVIISITWSGVPLLTGRRTIALIGSCLFGLFLASYYSLNQITRLLQITIGICAVLSLLFIFLNPQLGIHHDLSNFGSWRGVFLHKNMMARLMVLGVVLCLLSLISRNNKRIPAILFIVLYLFLIVMSESKTALVVLVCLVAFMPIVKIFRLNVNLFVSMLCFTTIIIGMLIFFAEKNYANILLLLGKDNTLTGRTELWGFVWEMIKEKFWFGYGYNAFWLGLDGPSAYVWQHAGWDVPHAHNGLLNIWLQIGFSGVVLITILIIKNILYATRLLRFSKDIMNALPLFFYMFVIFYNITENDLLSSNTLFWILFCTYSLKLSDSYHSPYIQIVNKRRTYAKNKINSKFMPTLQGKTI